MVQPNRQKPSLFLGLWFDFTELHLYTSKKIYVLQKKAIPFIWSTYLTFYETTLQLWPYNSDPKIPTLQSQEHMHSISLKPHKHSFSHILLQIKCLTLPAAFFADFYQVTTPYHKTHIKIKKKITTELLNTALWDYKKLNHSYI